MSEDREIETELNRLMSDLVAMSSIVDQLSKLILSKALEARDLKAYKKQVKLNLQRPSGGPFSVVERKLRDGSYRYEIRSEAEGIFCYAWIEEDARLTVKLLNEAWSYRAGEVTT